jgi:hypothetical protein
LKNNGSVKYAVGKFSNLDDFKRTVFLFCFHCFCYFLLSYFYFYFFAVVGSFLIHIIILFPLFDRRSKLFCFVVTDRRSLANSPNILKFLSISFSVLRITYFLVKWRFGWFFGEINVSTHKCKLHTSECFLLMNFKLSCKQL